MARAFFQLWSRKTWTAMGADGNEGELLDHAASAQYRRIGLRPGDALYVVGTDRGALLLLGRMTVARVLTDLEAQAEHSWNLWDERDPQHAFADVCTTLRFDRILSEEDARALRDVEGKGLKGAGDGYVSGQGLTAMRQLAPESAALLDGHLEDATRVSSDGGLRRLSQAARKAVEDRAMQVAREELEARDFDQIEDVSETASWDFEARKGVRSARVEVKGSSGAVSRVELTANEVDSALTFPYSVLVVVEHIELDDEDRASGGRVGRFRDPWVLRQEDLTCVTYSTRI